ncbi:MAG: ATP-dependent Clp protease adaptor ClpS [Planctomycetia bacterium]
MNTSDDPTTTTKAQPEAPPPKAARQPLYNVILLDDEDHTYSYVIRMLQKLFRYTEARAYQAAREVDLNGRVVLLTTTREHAEFKQEEIHGYGPDDLVAACKGSMTSVIEPITG